MARTDPAPRPRAYDATRRRENGRASRAATRARVLAAAGPLLRELGWTGTTVGAIAGAAGVSVQTVYATVGPKADVLRALLAAAVAGEDPDAPLVAQRWVAEVAADPDPRSQLQRLAHESAQLGVRTAWLHRLLREAAADDPALTADLARQHRDRWTDQRAFVGLLHGDLREDLTLDDAADVVFGYVSYEVWDLFCLDRGWSPDRLARLTADTLAAALLGPVTSPGP